MAEESNLSCLHVQYVGNIVFPRGSNFNCNVVCHRYSAALLSTPVDVELLVNYADCCVRRAELEVDHPSSDVQWNAIKELYELGLGAYASACANADARIGDDLAGLLHNWGSGLFSFAEVRPLINQTEFAPLDHSVRALICNYFLSKSLVYLQRSPDLEEALNFVKSGQEKFFTAIKFGSTDANIRNGLGECLTSFVDKLQGKGDFLQRGLDLLQAACNDGYGAVLKIDSSNIAALLGLGEAYLSAGKILIGQGLFPRARESLSESVRNFERAFELMKEGELNFIFVLGYHSIPILWIKMLFLVFVCVEHTLHPA